MKVLEAEFNALEETAVELLNTGEKIPPCEFGPHKGSCSPASSISREIALVARKIWQWCRLCAECLLETNHVTW